MATTNLKALIVVTILAITIFALAKPICLRFMGESDFARRRNIWLVLTVVAFASPSFWLFVIVATPLLAWGGNKDSNPVAFYLFTMHIIPPTVHLEIPTVLINHLFELNLYRILSLVVLLPTAWRVIRSGERLASGTGWVDVFILSFAALQLLSFLPYESITNAGRRGFLLFIDAVLVYYVVSRICTSRKRIVDAMASFAVICGIFAAIALFESIKGWLLYHELATVWGVPARLPYLLRDDILRAAAAVGHSLALGYALAIGLGFWLYLRTLTQPLRFARFVTIGLCVGLLAAYSRSPWIVAVIIYFAYVSQGPRGGVRFSKALFVASMLTAIVLVSPIGHRVIENLPFVGSVDAANVIYRERLAKASWQLIQQHPWFGDPFVLQHLQSLRQGEGIIDLVNTYAAVAMFYGLVGLVLFLAPAFIATGGALRAARWSASRDADLSRLGANLVACMLGTLVMMTAGSFGTILEKMYYVLVGLAVGYGCAVRANVVSSSEASPRATSGSSLSTQTG